MIGIKRSLSITNGQYLKIHRRITVEKQYNYNVCTRAQSESMCHVGMNRDSIKEAVRQKLCLGQKYRLKSVATTTKDEPVDAVCELLSMGKNQVIFKHQNRTLEGFTYQDIWKQITDGTIV